MPQLVFFAVVGVVAYVGYRAFVREAERITARARRAEAEQRTGSHGTLIKDPVTGEYHLTRDCYLLTMAEAIAEHAPAKVNLALHITGQRADGYHLLESIVVFTEEGDRVFVEASDEDRFTISGPFSDGLDAGQDNLVTRARDHLRALVGSTAAVAIHLEKNLPVASGIGGGS